MFARLAFVFLCVLGDGGSDVYFSLVKSIRISTML